MADAVVSEKQCGRCGEVKALSEFSDHKTTKDRKRPECRTCQSAYHKAYGSQNAVRLRAQKAEYRRSNAEKVAESVRKWRDENRERHLANNRAYYEKNAETIRLRAREWHWNNRDRAVLYSREYRAKNHEAICAHDRHRSKSEARKGERRLRYQLMRPALIEQYRTDAKKRLHNLMSCSIRQSLKGTKNCRSWLELVPYTIEELRVHLLKTVPAGYTWDDFMSGILHIDHIIPQSAFNFSNASDIDFQICWGLDNLQLMLGAENIRKGARLAKPFQPSLAGI